MRLVNLYLYSSGVNLSEGNKNDDDDDDDDDDEELELELELELKGSEKVGCSDDNDGERGGVKGACISVGKEGDGTDNTRREDDDKGVEIEDDDDISPSFSLSSGGLDISRESRLSIFKGVEIGVRKGGSCKSLSCFSGEICFFDLLNFEGTYNGGISDGFGFSS